MNRSRNAKILVVDGNADEQNLIGACIEANDYDVITAENEAEKSNATKPSILAQVSHELRTPIMAIQIFGELIEGMVKRQESSSKILKKLRRLMVGIDRLGIIVDSILDLSKIEAGCVDYAFAQQDFLALVHQMVEEVRPLFDDKRLKVRIENKIPKGHAVICDDRHISRVIQNLLSNAIKFSDRDTTIAIEPSEKGGETRLSITNTGVAIPENEMEWIFNPFAQSSLTHTETGGAGLGLSFCQNIIDAHNGKIWAENRPENQVLFAFVLPKLEITRRTGQRLGSLTSVVSVGG